MAEWSLSGQEAAAAMDGRLELVGGGGLQDTLFNGVGTDTRVDMTSKLFFALVGDVHDAHSHLKGAIEKGATGVVIHRPLTIDERAFFELRAKQSGFPIAVVEVANTLTALQALGRHWRNKCRAMILGITGTNGKTTTKEFTAALLASKFNVQFSKGSFNNHWGVPLSLLSIGPEHEVAVIEMGMNHPGELKLLSRLAEPDAVVCTMVGRGHLEGVGSIEGAAAAKSEIYEFAPAKATFIFNLDNKYTAAMLARFAQGTRRTLTFGDGTGDVSLRVKAMTPDKLIVEGEIKGVTGQVEVPVFGRHNATNLMAATCLALASGMTPQEIWSALPNCRSAWGRNQWVALKSGARVLFDGYNANPESMTAALENARLLRDHFRTASGLAAKTIAVLGEMRELGDHAAAMHEEIGRIASSVGFHEVIFLGPSHVSFKRGFEANGGTAKTLFTSVFDAKTATDLSRRLSPGDFVLIKGSRGMSLENFLKELEPVDFEAKK